MGTIIVLFVIVIALLGVIAWQLWRISAASQVTNVILAKHLELVVARGKSVARGAGRELLRQRLADRLAGPSLSHSSLEIGRRK